MRCREWNIDAGPWNTDDSYRRKNIITDAMHLAEVTVKLEYIVIIQQALILRDSVPDLGVWPYWRGQR